MHVQKFTEEYRERELSRGRESLYYFMTAILGQVAEDKVTKKPTVGQFHYDMCTFLEGRPPHYPWNKAVICAFRGGSKSNTVRCYVLWRGLYIEDFSTLCISNSADNAKSLYVLKLTQLLRGSARSEYIQWLFKHRIRDGWQGTTTEEIWFKTTDPNAEPAVHVAGIETKIESAHPDLVVIDDPEGSEAEKGKATNEDSYGAFNRAIPLLKDPARSQLLVVATPWGDRPLVYRLREQEGWKTEADNPTCSIKFFWRPIITETGESAWPERFPLAYLDTLKRYPIWDTQYMLRRRSSDTSIFTMKTVYENCYQWSGGIRDLIVYKGFKFDADKVSEDGFVHPDPIPATVRLRQLRFYMHFDPLHRTLEARRTRMNRQRPAKAAIAVVGVAPDYHVFLVKAWTSSTGDLHDQASALFRFYCMYCPYLVSYEAIGAQAWLESHIKSCEARSPEWAQPESSGLVFDRMKIPRLSSRLKEGHKTIESKEMLYREALSPWVNHGIFHFHRTDDGNEEALHQLENVLNEDEEVDIIDCIAQGPEFWKPPVGDQVVRNFNINARRKYVETFVKKKARGWKEKTGFRSPFSGRGQS